MTEQLNSQNQDLLIANYRKFIQESHKIGSSWDNLIGKAVEHARECFPEERVTPSLVEGYMATMQLLAVSLKLDFITTRPTRGEEDRFRVNVIEELSRFSPVFAEMLHGGYSKKIASGGRERKREESNSYIVLHKDDETESKAKELELYLSALGKKGADREDLMRGLVIAAEEFNNLVENSQSPKGPTYNLLSKE